MNKFVKQHCAFINFYCTNRQKTTRKNKKEQQNTENYKNKNEIFVDLNFDCQSKTILQMKIYELLRDIIQDSTKSIERLNDTDCLHQNLANEMSNIVLLRLNENNILSRNEYLQKYIFTDIQNALKEYIINNTKYSHIAGEPIYEDIEKIKKPCNIEILKKLGNLDYSFKCNLEKQISHEQQKKQIKFRLMEIFTILVKKHKFEKNMIELVSYKNEKIRYLCSIAFLTSFMNKGQYFKKIDESIIKQFRQLKYKVNHKVEEYSLFDSLIKMKEFEKVCSDVLASYKTTSKNMFALFDE